MTDRPDNPFLAIGLKLCAVVMFVVMGAFIKAASSEVPPGQAVFFRSFCALPVIILWLASRRELATGLRTTKTMHHVFRGMIGTTAMGLSFAGLAILPLSEVKAIQYVVPIFVVILAAMFLGETIRKVRLTAVFMGLIGVLIILWPRLSFGGDETDPRLTIGALLVLGGSLCAAAAQVMVRKMVAYEHPAAIAFWFSIVASLISLLSLPFGWVVPSVAVLGYLAGAGLVGGLGQIFGTNAYRFGDAGIVAPFDYASILFALAIGYVFFSEVPTPQMIIGSLIVIAAGVLIIFREHQLRLQRGKARQHVTKYG
ncbi:DMT family transporter [Rhodobacteraceae bacterium]|nr:DMT family transporter [Paracoccaceae bacterium]